MTDKAEVLAYARVHGDVAAAERFGVRRGTIRQWRHRERERATRPAPARVPSTVVEAPVSATAERPPPGPSSTDRKGVAQGDTLHHGGGVSSRTIPGQRERVFTAEILLIPMADYVDEHGRRQAGMLTLARYAGDLGLGVCLACGQRDRDCWCD
jgi:hypothetical protein